MVDFSNNHPWVITKRVLPQHTDHAGVMWHGAYLAWLEEARVEALAKVGLPYSELAAKGYEMPLVSIKVNYLKSLLHGEEVELESWVLPAQGVRRPWITRFFKKSRDIAAEAYVDLVLVKTFKGGSTYKVVRKPPVDLDKVFRKLQKGPEK